ncbi:hypothetical protein KU43P_32970 [Pseudomonas sp. KU43P]|nr:hypothetical protein KU43P_32970 [Pseudomonas sp. KU43P]
MPVAAGVLIQLSPKDARAVLTGAQASVKVDLSGIDVQARTLEANGESINLQIVRPANAKGELPVFMFFHGGWVLGDFPTHQRLIRLNSMCCAMKARLMHASWMRQA